MSTELVQWVRDRLWEYHGDANNISAEKMAQEIVAVVRGDKTTTDDNKLCPILVGNDEHSAKCPGVRCEWYRHGCPAHSGEAFV